MSHPPLKLVNCFFSDLQIKENKQFAPADDYWIAPTPDEDINFRVRIFHDSNDSNMRWRAGLLIESSDIAVSYTHLTLPTKRIV